MKISENAKFVKLALHIIGFLLSVVPPIICTASYFPLWQEREKALSGGVLILLLISAVPLYKLIKERLKSPSSCTVWLILFVIFFSLSKIADEMTVISFVGLIGNALGAVCFNIGKRIGGQRTE